MLLKSIQKLSFFVATLYCSLTIPLTASAQLSIPSSAEIGRSDSMIEKPDFRQVTSPKINIPEVRVDKAPDGAENVNFVLSNINLKGVSAYNIADLHPLWSDKIGTKVSITDVYLIAKKITLKYRNDGYIITQAVIPQQEIENGTVTIHVVEGFIDRVSLNTNNDTLLSERILQISRNLTTSSPLTAQDLERWLLIVNDIPGLSARSIIAPSLTTVGGADITIIPTIDPYNFNFNIDNYGSRYIGQVHLSGAAQFNNLFNAGDLLETQFVTDASDDELIYGSARLQLPINAYGSTLGIDFNYSDTRPGHDLETFEIDGYSKIIGVDVTHPFLRSRTQNLFGTLRFDYRDLISKNNIDSFKTRDKIATLRAGVNYNMFDTLWKSAVNEGAVKLSQGVNVFNASHNNDANMTRANGDPSFTKLEARISRLQFIAPKWSILTEFSGQIANNPLLSSEEFGVGGKIFGRGYDSSELVGDDGFATKLELRWNSTEKNAIFDDYQLFGFYDFGKIWNQETDVNSLEKKSLASMGFGLRANISKTFSSDLTIAQPLTKNVDIYNDENPRIFFNFGAKF